MHKTYKEVIYTAGAYRILEVEYLDWDLNGMCGDTFKAECHPDINPVTLSRQLRDFVTKIHEDGVFGYVLEKWDPAIGIGWTHIDSCYGFVGKYDPAVETYKHYIVAELQMQIRAGG